MAAPGSNAVIGACQGQGRRDYQEDAWGWRDGQGRGGAAAGEGGAQAKEEGGAPPVGAPDGEVLLVVADGMGGHVGGDAASRIIVDVFMESWPRQEGPIVERLRACLDDANRAITAAIEERPELDGMGSTLLAAVVSRQGLDWISVGDSPLWLFRGGRLERLNADHSMAPVLADLVAVGRITEEEAAADPSRNALRSAVSGGELALVDSSSQPRPLAAADRVLLASDGVMTLADERIAAVLQETLDDTPEDAAATLVKQVDAVNRPRQDNVTVLLYRADADRGAPLPDAVAAPAPAEDDGAAPAADDQPRKRTTIAAWLLRAAVVLALTAAAWWGWRTFQAEAPAADVEAETPAADVGADGPVGSVDGAVSGAPLADTDRMLVPAEQGE